MSEKPTGQAPQTGANFDVFNLATNPEGQLEKPKVETKTQPTTPDVEVESGQPTDLSTSEADVQVTTDDDEKDPRIQRANREAARYRVERNEARQQLEELQTRLSTLESKMNEETQKQVDEFIEKAKERELKAVQREREAEIEILKVRHNLSDDDVEVISKIDDADTMKAVAERMAKPTTQRRPAIGNSGGGDVRSAGSELIDKIYRPQTNPFDPDFQRSVGGGVNRGTTDKGN